MKKIALLPLAVCAGLLLQQPRTFAQDQTPDKADAKNAESAPHQGKGKSSASKDVQKGTEQGAASRANKSNDKMTNSFTAGDVRSKDATTKTKKTTGNDVQQTSQRQSKQSSSTSFAVHGSRSNNYNGQWVAGNTHSDWSRDGDHRWNNHDYRWYDGGWMIIDIGPSPDYSTGSVGSSVQASLAHQGYYNGPVDGYIGKGTRRAISHYERDNGLEINGRIDEPLLASLRLD